MLRVAAGIVERLRRVVGVFFRVDNVFLLEIMDDLVVCID